MACGGTGLWKRANAVARGIILNFIDAYDEAPGSARIIDEGKDEGECYRAGAIYDCDAWEEEEVVDRRHVQVWPVMAKEEETDDRDYAWRVYSYPVFASLYPFPLFLS